jgi:hypothetical protein
MLGLKDFVTRFVCACRRSVEWLTEQQKACLGRYRNELTLAKPCQIEVFEPCDPTLPYRLIMIFLFDKTKPDLIISVNSMDSAKVATDLLKVKYSGLRLNYERITEMIESFSKLRLDIGYSWTVYENVFGICFPYDPRLKDNPVAQYLIGEANSIEKFARTIFASIYSQA